MIEKAIFAILNGAPALSALVADRIYPLRAPQNAEAPFITYRRISGPRLRSIGGASGQANPRFQIDVFAASYASSKDAGTEVRLALDNFRGTAAGVVIRSCSLDSDRDLIDPDAEPTLYRVSQDFTLWHDE